MIGLLILFLQNQAEETCYSERSSCAWNRERGKTRGQQHSFTITRMQFQPMPFRIRKSAFNHSDFIFEVKLDGFRALAVIEHGTTQLISRNGHRFASFADLEKSISAGLPDAKAVIDGEICSLDKRGRPQFRDLLFHRGNYPCFLAFDLLMMNARITLHDEVEGGFVHGR
jgi:ATP-dependent DNA ligase